MRTQRKKFVYVLKGEDQAPIKGDKQTLLDKDSVVLALRRDPVVLCALETCNDTSVVQKFLNELGKRANIEIKCADKMLSITCDYPNSVLIDHMIYVFQCLNIDKLSLKIRYTTYRENLLYVLDMTSHSLQSLLMKLKLLDAFKVKKVSTMMKFVVAVIDAEEGSFVGSTATYKELVAFQGNYVCK